MRQRAPCLTWGILPNLVRVIRTAPRVVLDLKEEEMVDRRNAAISGRPYALVVLWVGLMIPASLLMRLLQDEIGFPYEILPFVMLGPLVAGIICRLVVPSWFPDDAPRASSVLFARAWMGLALVIALCAIGTFTLMKSGNLSFVPKGWSGPVAFATVIVGQTIGAWCEEAGFRGVMYRALSARLRPWACILINGLFFGLCHIQYFKGGVVAVAAFMASTVLIVSVMAFLWVGSWTQRLLMCGAFHAVVNITQELRGADEQAMSTHLASLAVVTICAVAAYALGKALRVGEIGSQAR